MTTLQRRNLVIEGLKGETETEMVTDFIKLSSALNVTVYAMEVEQIVQMNHRDDKKEES